MRQHQVERGLPLCLGHLEPAAQNKAALGLLGIEKQRLDILHRRM
ncbi:hypothetical protein [Deinococcus multiflagellatus]|uniref:Uncharacterized protein n=1 Tax=Deinococcus multiflagellatus TaxID=1656887 RepID=A0ABW1ZPT0_9DEIO